MRGPVNHLAEGPAMSCRWVLLGLAWLAGAASAAEAPGAAPDAARLVTRLGSDSFAERESAAGELDRLGPAALPALRRALTDADAEVRRRAAALIEAIEQREQSRRLLQPLTVRLSYKDIKAADAVADFARRTGGPVQLSGDVGKLADRTVTLETEELPYWEALERLCRAAGLREATPAPEAPRPQPPDSRMRVRRTMLLNSADMSRLFQAEGPLLLEDGKAEPLPTAHSGAVRVRALPPTAAEPAHGDQPAALLLEIKPDPHVSWEALAAVRVDEAVDDQGQALRQARPYVGRTELRPAGAEETILVIDGEISWPSNHGQRRATLELLPGERPSRSLRRLRGTLAAWVRTPPERLLETDDILKAEGRELDGADGSRLKVRQVSQEKDGVCRLTLEVTEPPPLASLDTSGASRVVFLDRGAGPNRVTVTDRNGSNPFSLLDARGRSVPLISGSYQAEDHGARRVYRLEYQSARDQGPPVRLVYTGSRNVLVEASFVLEDVPLVKKP
jgi:hypothetical protein